MKLAISFRAAAEAEFDDAFDFYEKRQMGLGIEFVAEVQRELDQIAENPLMHQVVLGDIRMGVVRRFPYTIFFRHHPHRIEVIAIFHTSRDPAIWQGRA
jgi:toxin ParE1/3/4